MAKRVSLKVEVPGLHVEFEGDAALYEGVLRDVLEPLARGAWRGSGPMGAAPEGPSGAEFPSPAAPAAADRAAPEAPRREAPSPAPEPPAPAPAAPVTAAAPRDWDPAPLYRALAGGGGRRSEKDAVLLALVDLGLSGKRDSSPAEIVSHLEARGFPASDLKPKPILAKLCHRKGLALPGILPNTFRASPSGTAHVWRLARGS
jgi:hypothetical protein